MKTIGKVLALAMALSGIAAYIVAQTAPKPAFEVASIKLWTGVPNNPGQAKNIAAGAYPYGMMITPGGRFTGNKVNLRQLVAAAYNVPNDRIFGGPKWVESDRFDVEARPEKGAILPGNVKIRNDLVRSMLQSMLADRFGLKIHHEPKEYKVYALRVDKGGPKLQKAERDCTANPDPNALTYCHAFSDHGPRFGFEGRSIDMSDLAMFLGERLGRPGVDETRIQGLFDVKVGPWNPSAQSTSDKEGGYRGNPVVDLNSFPSLFVVIEEQLGLKLNDSKTNLDTIVIEAADKPSEN